MPYGHSTKEFYHRKSLNYICFTYKVTQLWFLLQKSLNYKCFTYEITQSI